MLLSYPIQCITQQYVKCLASSSLLADITVNSRYLSQDSSTDDEEEDDLPSLANSDDSRDLFGENLLWRLY